LFDEAEVLRAITTARTTQQVMADIGGSDKTVKLYLDRLVKKGKAIRVARGLAWRYQAKRRSK
jgi:predicted transcriptional regulator